MKKILHFVLLSLLAMEISSQWTIVNSAYPGNLYCLRFQDINSGYITGSTQGILFRTTDGGNSGISLNTGTTNSFYDLYFFDAQTGFLAGTAGQILMTTDAGTSWTPKTNGSDTLYNIVFPTMNIGYCVGGGSSPIFMYSTINGGSSWSSVTSPTSNILKGVFFVNEVTGWVCGYNGALYMTTDGGSTWSNRSQPSSYSFEKVFFIDASTGIVVGSSGSIFKTTNGGTNWNLKPSGITEGLYDIGFVGPVFLWSD